MKLRKVMAVLGLSTCLISSQVLPAVAEEEPAVQQEVQEPEQEPDQETEEESEPEQEQEAEPEQEPEQEAESEPEQEQEEEAEQEPEQEAEPEQEQEEESEPEKESEEEAEQESEQESEEESEPGSEAESEQESEEETAEQNEPEEPSSTEGQTTDTEQEPEETGDNADEKPQEEAGEVVTEDLNQESQESAEEGSSLTETFEEQQPSVSIESGVTEELFGIREENSFLNSIKLNPVFNIENILPSNKFPDNRDKIKYNVELPLENIPSFITQEMIVGALKCQDEMGYPASVTIAQIIQESGYGQYGPGGEDGEGLSYLAYQYNNLFGIKGTGPAGSVDMRTGEQTADGTGYMTTAGFRVYNTYTECIEDRAELLANVYSDLTFGVEDANTFAIRVGSRWATDVDYGLTLIRVMERYDLYRLDEMTLGEFSDMLGAFVNPCPGAVLTSTFGYRTAPTAGASTYHKGIDLGTGEYNIPTYAAAEGTVIFAGDAGTAGMMIVIDHGDGLVTKYMHHDKIYVEEGDEVEKGQQIGLSGTTGVSTGNHLHFQVEVNGQAVDPMEYLNLE